MPDYQITRVSDDIREWNNPKGGIIYYHKVMLDGWEKPVSIGKKKAHALSVGDTISGTIERTDSPEDKWHAAPMGNFGGGGSSNSQPAKYAPKSEEQQESIARSVALKAAVDATNKVISPQEADSLLSLADKFLAWLQGGQGSSESTDPKEMTTATNSTSATTKTTPGSSGYDKFKQQGQALRRDERDEYNDTRSHYDEEPMPEWSGE